MEREHAIAVPIATVICMEGSPPFPLMHPHSLRCTRSAIVRRADRVAPACRSARDLVIPAPPSQNRTLRRHGRGLDSPYPGDQFRKRGRGWQRLAPSCSDRRSVRHP